MCWSPALRPVGLVWCFASIDVAAVVSSDCWAMMSLCGTWLQLCSGEPTGMIQGRIWWGWSLWRGCHSRPACQCFLDKARCCYDRCLWWGNHRILRSGKHQSNTLVYLEVLAFYVAALRYLGGLTMRTSGRSMYDHSHQGSSFLSKILKCSSDFRFGLRSQHPPLSRWLPALSAYSLRTLAHQICYFLLISWQDL